MKGLPLTITYPATHRSDVSYFWMSSTRLNKKCAGLYLLSWILGKSFLWYLLNLSNVQHSDGLDLRTNTIIDVSKSIWILASNKGDDLISEFYNKNLEGKSDRERRQVSFKSLERDLSKLFVEEYTVSQAQPD
jgi:hypothetical protein